MDMGVGKRNAVWGKVGGLLSSRRRFNRGCSRSGSFPTAAQHGERGRRGEDWCPWCFAVPIDTVHQDYDHSDEPLIREPRPGTPGSWRSANGTACTSGTTGLMHFRSYLVDSDMELWPFTSSLLQLGPNAEHEPQSGPLIE